MSKLSLNPKQNYNRTQFNSKFRQIRGRMHLAAVDPKTGKTRFTDCYTGKTLYGGDSYEYEHLRSAEELFVKYRGILSDLQITEVVNFKENVQVILRSINRSTGKRRFEDWCTPKCILKFGIDVKVAFKSIEQADIGIQRVISLFQLKQGITFK